MSAPARLEVLAAGLAARGLPLPHEVVVDAVLGPARVVVRGRPTLQFGSNSYLGLATHPAVVEAARAATARWGSATTGSRVANGTFGEHAALERELAAAFGRRHAIVFTTGHQANLGAVAGLAGPDDTVVIDAEAHASLFDGARLSGAAVLSFRHDDVADLARKLAHATGRALVVTESLHSIRGEVAPLAAILDACRARGARLLVDEAHAVGVYGARGLGVCEAEGLAPDVITGTFSKSLASVGGFAVADDDALPAVRRSARAYLFTASGTPASIAAARAALALATGPETGPALRDRLRAAVSRWRSGLARLGLRVGGTDAPIVPIWLDGAEAAVTAWADLLEAGLYTNLVVPPGCPRDRAGLRTSVGAGHDDGAVDDALAVVARVLA